MAPTTPEDWLPILAKRLDDAQPGIELQRSYVNGNAPLPEGGGNSKPAWIAFQKKARTNFGGIACRSHANRIVLAGVRVGPDASSPASQAARRIYRDNRLPMQVSSAVWDMLSARTGYLVAGVRDGHAIITAEKPELFYAEPDPLYPWQARAAIKVWRDSIAGTDHARVWVPGVRATFVRESYYTPSASSVRVVHMVNSGGWTLESQSAYQGDVPVWIFDREDGLALVEPHTDVIDRLNTNRLQRLVTTAMQAFKQRALKKDPAAPAPPDVDGNGNPIDYQAAYEAAPGALWDLPEGVTVVEMQATDIRPMLEGEKQDAREFSGCVGTPVSMLTPDGQNQSAAGAAATTAQQVDACKSDIARIRLAVASAMLTALRVEGVEVTETIEVDFEDPAWVTLAEKMDAYSKAIASGMSVQMAQKTYLSWSQDQIDEDDRNRRLAGGREQLAALAGSVPDGVGG